MPAPVISAATPGIEGLANLIVQLEKIAPVFFLVMARTFGLSLQAPFFSSKQLPPQARATLIVMLSMMYMLSVQPKIGIDANKLPMIMFALAMVKEVLIGVIFGFSASILVSAIQAAGELIDVQMGLSMVMLFNPQTKSQSSAMGRLFYNIQLMAFIIAKAHLFLLAAFFTSFDMVPIGKANFGSPIVIQEFIKIVGKLFYFSIQLALPVLIVLFIIDFSLGITNKVSPQINVLELNFAMKPTTGMLILLIICTSLVSLIGEYSTQMVKDGLTILKALAKGIPPG
jgi:flagellar biosynthetic protein FliR